MISVVSSAKDNIDALDVEFGISFMYNKNKRGPKIKPWGIPQVIVCMLN